MPEKTASFGYLLPTREIVMSQSVPDCGKILELAKRAESLGFDSLWAGDSVLARPRLEPLTTLASVAPVAPRIKLGTAVLLSALRHPVVLANELANLDLLTNGRLILGLGIAARNPAVAREFKACGIDFRRRVGIFEEGLTIMKRLWEGEQVTFHGRHFQLDGVRAGLRPQQRPGIPVWLAGSVESSFRRVLRLGDGWFPLPASPEAFARNWQHIEALGREMGRKPQELARAVYMTVNLNDDVSRAENEVRAFMEPYYGVPYEKMAAIQPVCAGPAARCIEWVQAFIDRGAETIVVRFGSPDQPGQLERFAAEVMTRTV